MSVGGHFEEVEDPADISVQPSQGLGDGEPTSFDELDGEASQAGGVLRAVAPAGRFIVATAKVYGLTLVTADARLLRCRDIHVLPDR